MRQGTVFVMHGVIESPDRDAFRDRNLIDSDKFGRFLEHREKVFVTLEAAARGEGDALTIDDAVVACADAALAARSKGHEVSLFVNPYNVESGSVYWFSHLNLVLDQTTADAFRLEGEDFPLKTVIDKKRFRKAVKARACRLPEEGARAAFIQDLARGLGLADTKVPRALRPLSLTDLKGLMAAGVRLENHGWTHSHPEGLAPEAVWRDIARGQAWLQDRLSVDSRAFAVPFGEVPHPDDPPEGLFETWYMADSRFFAGRIGPSLVNRSTLKSKDLK